MDEQEAHDAIEILHGELTGVAVALGIVFRMLAVATDDKDLIISGLKNGIPPKETIDSSEGKVAMHLNGIKFFLEDVINQINLGDSER